MLHATRDGMGKIHKEPIIKRQCIALHFFGRSDSTFLAIYFHEKTMAKKPMQKDRSSLHVYNQLTFQGYDLKKNTLTLPNFYIVLKNSFS